MTSDEKAIINLYIETLNTFLLRNKESDDLECWIPNCIKCLQFAVDNESTINENISFYNDILNTLYLLKIWIFENCEYAYMILLNKYKTTFTPEEAGNAFKKILERMKGDNEL